VVIGGEHQIRSSTTSPPNEIEVQGIRATVEWEEEPTKRKLKQTFILTGFYGLKTVHLISDMKLTMYSQWGKSTIPYTVVEK